MIAASVQAGAGQWDLDSCINHALTHNIMIRQRTLDCVSAGNDVTEAKDRFLPDLSASASQSMNFGRGLTSANTYANRNTSNFQWGVGMTLPLFQGLSAVRQVGYAKASLKAVLEELEAAKDDVTLNVMAQYLQVLYCDELHTVAVGQEELSRQELARRRELLEAGKIPEIDMLEAESQLAQDQLAVVTALNDRTLALVDLAQLLRIDDVESFDVAPLADGMPVLMSADEVYANALEHNHALEAGRKRIEAAGKYVGVAEAGYIPRLSFNAGIGSSYYTVNGYDNERFGRQMRDNFNTYLGFSLNIPIFDAFSTRNSVRRARVTKLAAELEYESASDNLYKAIRKAAVEAANAFKKHEAAGVAEKSTHETMMAIHEKYNLGRATPTEVETARTNYMKAVSQRVQSKYEYILRCRILAFYNRH